jgi:hypothetical protein
VKDVDGIGERGDVNYAKRASGVPGADFPNGWTDGLHRLPIVRLQTTLKPIDLEANLAASLIRERPHPVEGVSEKDNRPHARLYQSRYKVERCA